MAIKTCLDPSIEGDFPCNLNAITAVSLGLGAAGAALLFVIYLYNRVRELRNVFACSPSFYLAPICSSWI